MSNPLLIYFPFVSGDIEMSIKHQMNEWNNILI